MSGAIDGQPVKILFDTGAAISMMPLAEAKRLNLTMSRLNGVRLYGVGGDTAAYDANVKELTVDKFTTRNLALVVGGDEYAKLGASLVLGDDFFSQRDVEFDLREGVVRMFRSEGCTPPQLVYWGAAYSQATIEPWNRDEPRTQTIVIVNGKPVLAESRHWRIRHRYRRVRRRDPRRIAGASCARQKPARHRREERGKLDRPLRQPGDRR